MVMLTTSESNEISRKVTGIPDKKRVRTLDKDQDVGPGPRTAVLQLRQKRQVDPVVY